LGARGCHPASDEPPRKPDAAHPCACETEAAHDRTRENNRLERVPEDRADQYRAHHSDSDVRHLRHRSASVYADFSARRIATTGQNAMTSLPDARMTAVRRDEGGA